MSFSRRKVAAAVAGETQELREREATFAGQVALTLLVGTPALTLIGGTMQPVSLLWQPVAVGALFLAGLAFTFLGVKIGDVSIVTPVQGIKVLLVPAMALLIVDDVAGTRIWISSAIALCGIWFIQSTDNSVDRSKIRISIGCALLAAVSLTFFDLFIQRWAPAWGPGYFLPIAFVCTAVFSLGFLPVARPDKRSIRSHRHCTNSFANSFGVLSVPTGSSHDTRRLTWNEGRNL